MTDKECLMNFDRFFSPLRREKRLFDFKNPFTHFEEEKNNQLENHNLFSACHLIGEVEKKRLQIYKTDFLKF